jgi:hypothetical protein
MAGLWDAILDALLGFSEYANKKVECENKRKEKIRRELQDKKRNENK